MPLARVALALVVVALAAPAQASADRVAYGTAPARGQIRLAGPEVVYQASAADGAIETRAAGPGGATRVLHRTEVPRGRMGVDARFDASATHLAVSSALYLPCFCKSGDVFWEPSRLEAGPLAGPRVTPSGFCSTRSGPVTPVVDGSRLAYALRCDPASGADDRIVVQDLTTGAKLAEIPNRTPAAVRLAGRYVAWLEYDGPTSSSRIVVYDYEAGAESYRLTYADVAFDLQDDGKIAVSRAQPEVSQDCKRIDWASPSEPFYHRLPEPICARPVVRIVGDRVASIGSYESKWLVIGDLVGNHRRIASPPGTFDFDGERLAYVQRSCTGRQELFVDDLHGPERAEPGDCPVDVQNGRFRLRRDGTFRIGVGCPRGCSGGVTLRGQASRGRYSFDKFVRITVEPGATLRIAVRLTAVARRLLARRRSLRFTVDAETQNRDEGVAHVTLRRTLLARRGR